MINLFQLFSRKCELHGWRYLPGSWDPQDPLQVLWSIEHSWSSKIIDLRGSECLLCVRKRTRAYSHKLLTFLVFEMGLNTFVSQSVSTLGRKLWKGVMKCKIVMFFSGCLNLYDSYFDEAFFSLVNCCYWDWERGFFPVSMTTLLKNQIS